MANSGPDSAQIIGCGKGVDGRDRQKGVVRRHWLRRALSPIWGGGSDQAGRVKSAGLISTEARPGLGLFGLMDRCGAAPLATCTSVSLASAKSQPLRRNSGPLRPNTFFGQINQVKTVPTAPQVPGLAPQVDQHWVELGLNPCQHILPSLAPTLAEFGPGLGSKREPLSKTVGQLLELRAGLDHGVAGLVLALRVAAGVHRHSHLHKPLELVDNPPNAADGQAVWRVETDDQAGCGRFGERCLRRAK